jgi:hypothetical protein
VRAIHEKDISNIPRWQLGGCNVSPILSIAFRPVEAPDRTPLARRKIIGALIYNGPSCVERDQLCPAEDSATVWIQRWRILGESIAWRHGENDGCHAEKGQPF